MDLAVDQARLLDGLDLVASAVEVRTTIPILGHVRLEAEGEGVLRLTVHNLEYGLTSEVAAQVREPGVICLPAKSLLQLVTVLDSEICLRSGAQNHVMITAGRSRSRMPGLAADTFVALEPMPEGATPIVPELFLKLLVRVSFAAPKRDGGRYELPAILVRFTGEQLMCAATDGRCLAMAEAPVMVAAPYEFLLPSLVIPSLKKLLKDEGQVCLAISENLFFVQAGSRLLVARKWAGRFPDFSHILSEPDTPSAEMDLGALRLTLARILLFTESDRLHVPSVRFRLRPGELGIWTRNTQGGEAEGLVDSSYSGAEVAVNFNASYIQKFLDVVSEGKVRLWINSDSRNAEWRIAGDDSYRCVQAPLMESSEMSSPS
jgi:DNA polymerase-3 subunit beta